LARRSSPTKPGGRKRSAGRGVGIRGTGWHLDGKTRKRKGVPAIRERKRQKARKTRKLAIWRKKKGKKKSSLGEGSRGIGKGEPGPLKKKPLTCKEIRRTPKECGVLERDRHVWKGF